MTLRKLMEIADAGYASGTLDDGPLFGLIDHDGQPIDGAIVGDTLANFVVYELAETFDAAATDEDQCEEAIRVLAAAEDDLRRTRAAFQRTAVTPAVR